MKDDIKVEKEEGVVYTSSVVEELFNLEPNTTEAKHQLKSSTDIVEEDKDEEDKGIASQLATVYDYAIETFETQQEGLSELDPKYAARNAEVAAEYLKIALESSRTRAQIKNNKDKIKATKNADDNSAPGNITADRNEILRMIMNKGNVHDIDKESET